MYTFINSLKNIGSYVLADYTLNKNFKTWAMKCQSLLYLPTQTFVNTPPLAFYVSEL